MDYVKAYTTNKVFNFDDVMNAAILKLVFPNIKIKRVENPKDFADERSIIYGEDFLILGKQSIHFKGELFYEICNNFLVPYLNNIHIEDYDYYYDNLLIIFEMSAGKKYIT